MTKASVYVLIDPETQEIRYVGWTSQALSKRMYEHLYHCKGTTEKAKTHKSAWMRKVLQTGRPIIRLVQSVEPENCPDAERYWIGYFKGLGCDLTNATEGGEGTLGRHHTEAAKEKMRLAWERRRLHPTPRMPHSQETKDKLRAAAIKQFQEPQAREASKPCAQWENLRP